MTKITRVSGGNARVENLTRHCTMKYNQAVRGVAECAYVWVVRGVSVRQLMGAEAIEARNERARLLEHIAAAEIPGVVYRAAPGNEELARKERSVADDADGYAGLAALLGPDAALDHWRAERENAAAS